MKIQQISRFRLGEQERDAGYQISGASDQVDSVMESEFTGMYITLEIGVEPGTMMPYILDGGYNMEGTRFYLSQIYAEKDFKGRPTPYVHGLILDNDQMKEQFSKPEHFFRFSSANFHNSCNSKQQHKEKLPEIDKLKEEDVPELTVGGVREKYHLTDEVYEDLIRHFYEAIFSEGRVNLAFGWEPSLHSFEEVIKDMMFLVFSVTPLILRQKITFSSYQIKGMSNRMFTVIPVKYCEKYKGAWFNLTTGQSSQLKDEIEGTRFKTQFITYLRPNGQKKNQEFLSYVDNYLKAIYRRPEMKPLSAIANAMVPAFYAYGCSSDKKILDTYYKPINAGRILNSICRIKVDESRFVSDLLTVLLKLAIEKEAKINDIQFKNLQKYYLQTDSEDYEAVFIQALSARDMEAVKALFLESLKEKSSLKTDRFIAGLLGKIPNQQEILTGRVIQSIADRYPITESEELQDFYLNYTSNLYTDTMGREETSELIKKALEFVKNNQSEYAHQRIALYLERQLKQLIKYRLVLEKTVLERLFQTCVSYGQEYDLEENVLAYYMQVYLTEDVQEAVKYYGYLQGFNAEIGDKVNRKLCAEKSKIQDEYYCCSVLPGLRKKLKNPEDYIEQLLKVSTFPSFEHSYDELIKDFKNKAEAYLRGANDEETVRKFGRQEAYIERGEDGRVLLLRYQKLKKRTQLTFFQKEINEKIKQRMTVESNTLVRDPETVGGEILKGILNQYWELVDLNTISSKFYAEDFEEVRCGHDKCKKIEQYYRAYMEFWSGMHSSLNYQPSVEILTVLTTTECLDSLEVVNERIKRLIERTGIRDYTMSLDVLLMKYYNFAKKNFDNTDFLKKLKEDQIYELLEQNYNMVLIYPELSEKMRRYMKSIKKKKRSKKREVLVEEISRFLF